MVKNFQPNRFGDSDLAIHFAISKGQLLRRRPSDEATIAFHSQKRERCYKACVEVVNVGIPNPPEMEYSLNILVTKCKFSIAYRHRSVIVVPSRSLAGTTVFMPRSRKAKVDYLNSCGSLNNHTSRPGFTSFVTVAPLLPSWSYLTVG